MKPTFPLLTAAALAAQSALAQNTLGNALDAPELTWTTGGIDANGWTYLAGSGFGDTSFDGIDSAQCGQTADLGESWLSTTVVGPGTISFWWFAHSEPETDWLEFYVNETLMDHISGVDAGGSASPSGWRYSTCEVPSGTNVLTWKYVKDFAFTGGSDDTAYLDRVQFVTNAPPLGAALNTCGVNWTSGGNTNETFWLTQSAVTHDGALAARTGDTYHGQTNWLEAKVVGSTNVSFWWKVSSETNADVLEFYTNGVFAKRISGEVNWQSNYFRLKAGTTNTVRWVYRRDASVTAGQNAGWLDEVKFNPAPAVTNRYDIGSLAKLPNGTFQLSVNGEPGCPCQVQVSSNLTSWTALTNFSFVNSTSVVTDTAAPLHNVRFYRALAR